MRKHTSYFPPSEPSTALCQPQSPSSHIGFYHAGVNLSAIRRLWVLSCGELRESGGRGGELQHHYQQDGVWRLRVLRLFWQRLRVWKGSSLKIEVGKQKFICKQIIRIKRISTKLLMFFFYLELALSNWLLWTGSPSHLRCLFLEFAVLRNGPERVIKRVSHVFSSQV